MNDAGHPRELWWNYTSENQKMGDDDLRFLRDLPTEDMESFGLDHVAVTDDGMANLPAMPKLTKLEVSGPRLTTACLRTLYRFPRLEYLALPGLRSANAGDFAALGQLKELEFLNFEGADINDDAVPTLVALPRLQTLLLDWAYDGSRGPKLTPAAIAQLGECQSLECLRLSGCAVDDATLTVLARKLPQLTELFIAKTQITDASIDSLKKLEHLEWLSISETRVTDAGIAALAGHPSIKTLSLDGTRVGDAAFATFATMPKLREIWANRVQFSDGAVANFKKQHPNVRVEFTGR